MPPGAKTTRDPTVPKHPETTVRRRTTKLQQRVRVAVKQFIGRAPKTFTPRPLKLMWSPIFISTISIINYLILISKRDMHFLPIETVKTRCKGD